ncbi:carboxypeptidase-like regulatory domain-containing protein [Flavobacterium enshiense]|uniref:carboxypeptidase-like regulatory domain-containing protein n=1 Tax=Flavobacterium enshiense TaxID=1341165 RepID=UPI00345D88FE
MKSKFYLDITSPCSEDFNKFNATVKGGFCNSCSKEVIDFTKSSPEEIVDYFNKEKSKNVCGRFKTSQVRNHNESVAKKKNGFGFLSGIGFACISFFNSLTLQAQEINPQKKSNANDVQTEDTTEQEYLTVKGVVSEGGLPLPGVSVVVEGTLKGTQTDMDGNFAFTEKLKKGDVLVFSFIGLESKKVTIESGNSDLKVDLNVNMNSCNLIMMGKVAKKGVYASKK